MSFSSSEEEAEELDLDDGGDELLLEREDGLPRVEVDPAKDEVRNGFSTLKKNIFITIVI